MSYIERIEQMPPESRWPALRRWMKDEPTPLYRELREFRPVLELPEVTLVARFEDCRSVLSRHDSFTVKLYEPKQGDYWMAQDDTPRHWREKSIMRTVMDLEDLEGIRTFVADKAKELLANAGGAMDVVDGLSRAVPIALVQELFGFDESDPAKLAKWSYWNQYDAFHNQPFDADVVEDPDGITRQREAANAEMGQYLQALLGRRAEEIRNGNAGRDPVTRLLLHSASGALVDFDILRVARNVGGLLIGTVETTSHAVVYALAELLEREDAICAARNENSAEFDGYVFEALRFRPPFPYFFRMCELATEVAGGTDYATSIQPGTIVLTLNQSAMFDEAAVSDPETFDHSRSRENDLHFGYGLHECLGRHVGEQMIPEIVRQVLRLADVRADGPIDYLDGPFPERFQVSWSNSQ